MRNGAKFKIIFLLSAIILLTIAATFFYREIISIVAKEFYKPNLPIIANFDVGHTDPQLVLPLGVKTEIDCEARRIRLVESWLK